MLDTVKRCEHVITGTCDAIGVVMQKKCVVTPTVSVLSRLDAGSSIDKGNHKE